MSKLFDQIIKTLRKIKQAQRKYNVWKNELTL